MLNVRYAYRYGRSLLSVHFVHISACFLKANRHGPKGAVPLVVVGGQCGSVDIVQARHEHRTSGRVLKMAELFEERLFELMQVCMK